MNILDWEEQKQGEEVQNKDSTKNEPKKNPIIDIDDYNSMSYFSEFTLGSNKQPVRLAFSTASPVSVVNS